MDYVMSKNVHKVVLKWIFTECNSQALFAGPTKNLFFNGTV